MGLNLVTLAEYKAYAGITSTNSDAEINSLLPKVSQLVKSICRRTFVDYVDEAKVEVKKGGVDSRMYLDEYPILSIGSVEYSYDYGQSYTSLVEYTDYVIDLEDNTVNTLAGEIWPKSINGYKITYYAGYEAIPDDLKAACLDLVTYYLKNESAVHSTRSPGSNTIQIEYVTKSTLPSHISRILDLYTASFD